MYQKVENELLLFYKYLCLKYYVLMNIPHLKISPQKNIYTTVKWKTVAMLTENIYNWIIYIHLCVHTYTFYKIEIFICVHI